MNLRIKYFASIREAVGQGSEACRRAAKRWVRCGTN